jgi:5'-3' exonuclease
MGIESFFGRYIKRKFKPAVIEGQRLPERIGSLFIDCNGIFHEAAQKVYGYGNFEGRGMRYQNDNVLVTEIIKKIEEIIRVTSPKDNFVLAPDGVAVAAKLNQQKSRRYLSALERKISFDSNQFTPGTDLMIKIDKAINEWIRRSKHLLPKRVIYSSHLDPGEGEHKIFHFIREKQILESDGPHIVYGLDSDLILLSLLSPLPNIYLMRENYQSMVNINHLKTLIINDFKFVGASDTMILKDFSVLTMFAGNDFLPRLPSFTEIFNFLEILKTYYKSEKAHLVDMDNNINFESLFSIMKRVTKIESSLLVSTVMRSKTGLDVVQTYPYPELVNCVDDNGKLDEDRFTNLWYCKQFCPATGELASLYEDHQYYTNSDIGTMVIEFLKTMQWVHKYYTEGYKNVSNMHFYPYFYAPFSKSICGVLDMIFSDKKKSRGRLNKIRRVDTKGNIQITAAHQLMLVIPRRSAKFIPPEVKDVYDTIMVAISPTKFIVKREGTNADWHKTVIIPPVNVKMASYALGRIPNYETPERLMEKEHIVIDNKDEGTKYLPKNRTFTKTINYHIQDKVLL